jgi:hypothetical protein
METLTLRTVKERAHGEIEVIDHRNNIIFSIG